MQGSLTVSPRLTSTLCDTETKLGAVMTSTSASLASTAAPRSASAPETSALTAAASATPASSAAAASTAASLADHVLLDHVNDLVGDPEVLDGAASDVALGHPPELVAVPAGADHLPQVDVHPVVAAHQVPVVSLTVLELHQHGVILCGPKERQGQHLGSIVVYLGLNF